jgi:hypothetical protein
MGSDFPHPQWRRTKGPAIAGRVKGHRALPPARLPQRPGPDFLSEAIPLFFIGRNKDRLWVVREADGRIGGIFLLKRSALRFANRSTPPWGCATMLVRKGFELDIENKGNPFVARVCAAAHRLYRHYLVRPK